MIVEGQKYKTKWSGTNKKWYESKGYKFTKNLDNLEVNVADLMPSSRAHFLYECDNDSCASIFEVRCRTYHLNLEKGQNCYCKDCMYKNISKYKIEKHKNNSYEFLQIYKQLLKGDIDKFPDGLVAHIKIEDAKELVLYLAEYLIKNELTNGEKNVSNILCYEILSKYHLISIANKFGVSTLLSYSYQDTVHPWEFQRTTEGFWEVKKNVVDAMDWFLNKLIKDGTIQDITTLPKISYKHKFIEYGISGLYSKFGDSFSRIMMYAYPEKYNEWDFIVPNNYYNEGKKKEILNWFIGKLYKDKVISCEEDIPKIVDGSLFKKYNLVSFFTKSFNDSTFKAISYIYPNRWKQWEFKRVPNDFWNNPQNVRECLIWVADKMITENIISSIEDILSCNLCEVFDNYKLNSLYIKYDVRFMYTLIYGESVNYLGKNAVIGNDGTKLDSLDEKFIHDILLKNFNDVYKPINGDHYNFRNDNERYVPDWIINDKIIIEYFGLYSDLNSNTTLRKYSEKTKRKIDYFSKLNNYTFIPIFRDDLKDNCKILNDKLKLIL